MFLGQKTIAKGRTKPVKILAENVTTYIVSSGTNYCFVKTLWGQVYIDKKLRQNAHLRQGDKVRLNIWQFPDKKLYGYDVILVSRKKGYLKISISELEMLLAAERLLKKSETIRP